MMRVVSFISSLFFFCQAAYAQTFDQGKALADASLKEKLVWIEKLASDDSDESTRILQYWLDGVLVYWPQENRLVRGIKEGRKYQLTDLMTENGLGVVSSRDIDRVKTNNSLRLALKQVLGSRQLASSDRDVRLAAIAELKRRPDYKVLPLLTKREATEQDDQIARQLSVLIGLVLLESAEANEQLEGLRRVSGELSPEVKDSLSRFVLNSTLDTQVAVVAQRELDAITRSLMYWGIGQDLFFGLSLGSVLLLAAIGLAITFGVMGVINMAHGEFIMLGAYTTFVIQQWIPATSMWSLLISIPAAFVVSGRAEERRVGTECRSRG